MALKKIIALFRIDVSIGSVKCSCGIGFVLSPPPFFYKEISLVDEYDSAEVEQNDLKCYRTNGME